MGLWLVFLICSRVKIYEGVFVYNNYSRNCCCSAPRAVCLSGCVVAPEGGNERTNDAWLRVACDLLLYCYIPIQKQQHGDGGLLGDWLTECVVEGAYYSVLGLPTSRYGARMVVVWMDGTMARDVDGSMEQKTEPSSNRAACNHSRSLFDDWGDWRF